MQSNAISICRSVCPLVYLKNHVSRLGEIFCACYDVTCCRGSVALWWQCNMLCTSFVDDVMFSHNGRNTHSDCSVANYSLQLARLRHWIVHLVAKSVIADCLVVIVVSVIVSQSSLTQCAVLCMLQQPCAECTLSFNNANCDIFRVFKSTPPPPHQYNRFTALFPGAPRWAGARREFLDFILQGKINRGRHINHPAGSVLLSNITFLIFAVLVVWCSHCRPNKTF